MDYRSLSGTDLEVSRVVLGTMTFGSQVDDEVAVQMVDHALAAGVSMFDTANAYNNGASEEMLARALGDRRDRVLIATKVFNPMGDGPDDRGLSRAAIRKAIDGSLKRLGTDYIDLYYLHQPDANVPIEETLDALNELVDAGKVRYLGLSNHSAWQMTEALGLSSDRDWQPPRVSQQMYNLLARRVEDEYASCSAHFDFLDIVYNPLAGGLLTGKHKPGSTPAEGTRFSMEMYRDRYWNEAQFDAVESLAAIAAGEGLSLIELSFRWLLSRPLVGCVIVGASSTEHLKTNLEACEGPALDDDVAARCDEVWQRLKGAAPAYSR